MSAVQPRVTYQIKIALGVLMMLGPYGAGSGRFDLWPGCYAPPPAPLCCLLPVMLRCRNESMNPLPSE
jgi:hypothetical protein